VIERTTYGDTAPEVLITMKSYWMVLNRLLKIEEADRVARRIEFLTAQNAAINQP